MTFRLAVLTFDRTEVEGAVRVDADVCGNVSLVHAEGPFHGPVGIEGVDLPFVSGHRKAARRRSSPQVKRLAEVDRSVRAYRYVGDAYLKPLLPDSFSFHLRPVGRWCDLDCRHLEPPLFGTVEVQGE